MNTITLETWSSDHKGHNSQTSMAAMYSYITQFFSGTLDPFWPHAALIAGSIIGGALVGLGIILEAP
ncbi:MAG: hypothetical protein WCB70_24010, partial [Xanthobacteraceae bacterium]